LNTRFTCFALTLALLTGCTGQPDQTKVPTEHPANPAAAEAPVPPSSQTLASPTTGTESNEAGSSAASVHAGGHDHGASHGGTAAAAPDAAGESTAATAPPAAGAKGGATVYTCPHHPEVTSDKPGECPKCHMKLRPRAASPGGQNARPHDVNRHGGSHDDHGVHGGAQQ
jgi:hypothetical protein